jgi:major membrane immunogen (membrane-anchored lipoprotein)
MGSKDIKKLTIEALIVVAISLAILFGGKILTSGQVHTRVQNEYSEMFSDVLEADTYQEIFPENIELYQGLNHVYQAYDSSGDPIGFVLDVSVEAAGDTSLHLLTGVTYDGAELTGIKHIHDEASPAPVSDAEIALIATQAVGNQIPMTLSAPSITDEDSDGTVTMITGLHDGVYYAQKLTKDNNGYIDYVQIEVENGFITRVRWDAFNVDMTTKDRTEAALSGAYSVSGENWATQSYNLCRALINCQDPERLAMRSDGTTDIVDGVTINIRTFVELAYECIDNSINEYDQETYTEDLKSIVQGIFGSDPETLGLINDEGFVAFSFEDYPNLFAELDDSGNAIGTLNVRQKINGADESISDTDIETIEVDTDDNNSDVYSVTVIGAEDGLSVGVGYDPYSENIDGLPISEIRTYIPGIPGGRTRTRYVLTAVNISYRFLKDYLDWMA